MRTPATVTEICKRLDGMPLAIELAAARVRALSLTEILDSLHDRFRLLTGGSRRAVRRQQSLRRLGRLVACAADRARAHPVPSSCRHSWADSISMPRRKCAAAARCRDIRSWIS